MIEISMNVEDIKTSAWRILGEGPVSVEGVKARYDCLHSIIKGIDKSTTAEQATIALYGFIKTFPSDRYTLGFEVATLLFRLLDVEEPTPKKTCFGMCFLGVYNESSYARALKEVDSKIEQLQDQIQRSASPSP